MIYKLSEIMELIGGGTPKTSVSEYWNGSIPWLSVKDFNNDNRYVYKTEKTITEEGLANSSTKLLNRDDSIISARGTVGEMAMIPFPMAFNQSCYGLRAKKEIVTPAYLYYLIKHNIHVLRKNTHGSVFDTITRDTFSGIEVDIPEIDIQSRIATMLSIIDDKIELNTAINENLEQQAQALSDKWVSEHMDCITMFPLAEIAEINPETYSPKDKWAFVYYLDTSSITNGVVSEVQLISPDIEKLPSRARRIVKANDIVYSTVRPNQLHFGIISNPLENMLVSTGFSVIRSKYAYISSPYIYHFLTSPDFIEKMQQLAEQSTSTFPSVKPSDIGTCLIPCADETEMTDITDKINDMYTMVSANQQENKRLADLRDTLLPKLMNGEIDVSQVKI